MRVLLINPAFEPGKKQKFSLPPLGLMYIGTILDKNGIDVEILDCNTGEWSSDGILGKITFSRPDVIGFSVMTPQIRNVLKMCKKIKSMEHMRKDIKIVLGGSHINSVGREIFDFSRDIDFLVYGEGEYTFLELVNALKRIYECEQYKAIRKIEGLVYLKDSKVYTNPVRPLNEKLDKLPFPDLNLVDIEKYRAPYIRNYPMMSMIASRGCPYQCLFCDAYKTHGRKLRLRSPKNIVTEMYDRYQKQSIRHFVFKDSTFIIDKEWVKEICSLLIECNLNKEITWNCNSRADALDKEVLELMKEAGCVQIGIGVESGSNVVLKNIRKNITTQSIRKAFRLCKEVGVQTYGFFMIGNPGDNPARVRQTIEFAKELDPDLVSFAVTMAFPGTDLHHWAAKRGYLTDEKWYMGKQKYIGVNVVGGSMNLPELSQEEQVEWQKMAWKEYCCRSSYIWKKVGQIRSRDQLKDLFKAGLEILRGTK